MEKAAELAGWQASLLECAAAVIVCWLSPHYAIQRILQYKLYCIETTSVLQMLVLFTIGTKPELERVFVVVCRRSHNTRCNGLVATCPTETSSFSRTDDFMQLCPFMS